MATSTMSRQVKEPVNPLIAGLEDLSIFNQKSMKKGDIAQLLDHTKKKLTSLDSERIISALDELISRCEIVTLLPFIIENMDRFSIMLGSDFQNVLEEYDTLQDIYTKALARYRKAAVDYTPAKATSRQSMISKDSSVSETDKQESRDPIISVKESEYHMALEAHHAAAAELANNVKIILRLFRTNPAAFNAIRAERKERSQEANDYIDTLYALREQIFARLVTTPGEERDKSKTTVQVMMREKKAKAQIQKLEKELRTTQDAKDKMIHEKNEEIRKLKVAISTIENDADLVNRKIISDAQKIEAAEIKNADGKKAKLQQELIQMKQKFQTTTNVHRENELALRRVSRGLDATLQIDVAFCSKQAVSQYLDVKIQRKYKMETEVENWINKFDGDMTDRQDELDELKEIYTEEKKQLEELEERFAVLDEKYNAIMEEKRIALERRLEAEKEFINMVKAATLLQSFWRAYRCRKALKLKQKKAKKGKKGKKKKK